MRYLFINSVAGIGSTGRIAVEQCKMLQKEGHICLLAYGRQKANCEDINTIQIGTPLHYRIHAVLTRIFDWHGFGSVQATKHFLQQAEQYNPDVIWLHNIHGYYINVEMLFDWIKKHPSIEVKWTLHDCWTFTGHCTYFDFVKCERWKTQCCACPQKKEYPRSLFFDNSESNYQRKQLAFTGVANLSIIVPSQWLGNLVKDSFLKKYPVEVVYNTIDASIFKPIPSIFREKYDLQDKKIVLGVANKWEKRKGLNDFYLLSRMLDDNFKIILVGLSKKQMKEKPTNILGIMHTDSPQQLAQIYTAADVFVNPTYEDNYPTVNLEAKACGTHVITYRTGGSHENIPDKNVIDKGALLELKNLIIQI